MTCKRPNILLITLDCLRADHLGCFSYRRKTSPTIDDLARNGILFTQATSVSSTTRSSFPAILGSIYPLMCDDLDNPFKNTLSVTEVLKKAGYESAAFHSNVLLSRRYGYHKGFDVFEDGLKRGKYGHPLYKIITRCLRKLITRVKLLIKGGENPKISGEKLNALVVEWVKNKTNNFFVWVHYMDIHVPYMPLPTYVSFFRNEHLSERQLFNIYRKLLKALKEPDVLSKEEVSQIIDLYDSCIRYADDCIKDLIDRFADLNKLENTVIIITADHGEEFGEHGNLSHHRKLYDELIRVPLIIYNLRGIKPRVIDIPFSLIDIAPTLVDLARVKKPIQFKGESLIPYIGDTKKKKLIGTISESDKLVRGKLFIENTRVIAYRTSRWKLIQKEKYTSELYDLNNDPLETKNLYEENKEMARVLKKEIEKHLRMIQLASVSAEKRKIEKVLKLAKL